MAGEKINMEKHTLLIFAETFGFIIMFNVISYS